MTAAGFKQLECVTSASSITSTKLQRNLCLSRKYRWFGEYGKAYNLKESRLNLSTTHASDLCEYASYQAYITGSNEIFYLREYSKAAVWKDVEALDPAVVATLTSTFQIPFRP